MHKTIALFARTAWLMLLLLVPSLAMADKQAWVEYQEGTATLTFHYDENKETTTATAKYDLNSGSDKPGWVTDKKPKQTVTTVVFDSCFVDARPTSTMYWFYTFTKLDRIEGIEYLNTSEVTDMDYMFHRCVSLTDIDLSHFDTGNVTTMERMFSNLELTDLDLSSFNTSKVLSMKNMFSFSRKLKSVNVTSFDTRNVTTMYGMFDNCESLTVLDLSSFYIYKMKEADGVDRMFRNCSKLRNIMVGKRFKLHLWETIFCKPCDDLFKGATSLPGFDPDYVNYKKCKDLSEGGYLNDVNVTPTKWVEYQDSTATLTFHYDRFKDYTEATGKYDFNKGDTVPEWQGKDIAKVVIAEEMKKGDPTSCYRWFYGMDKVATIEGLENLNTSEVTNMSGMFHGCSLLDTLDLSSFNTAKVTDMSDMMSSCPALKEVFAGENFVVADGVTSTAMFEGCANLPGFDAGNVDATKAKDITEGGYLNFVNVTASPWLEYQGDSRTLTFHYDKQRALTTATSKYDLDVNSISSTNDWQETSPTKVVFREEFSEVLPRYCKAWFSGMKYLKEIEGLEYLNTSMVADMTGMFQSCKNLTSLDLTNFDTRNLIVAQLMFESCSSLQNIYVSEDFSLPKLLFDRDMFKGCYSLPNFDFGATTKSKANYIDGYLTLRRQFAVGDKGYNVDGYGDNARCNADVDFTDGESFMSSFDFKLADGKTASYTRTMADKWGTLCLPFEINADDADCNFYAINTIDADKLTLTRLSGTIAAGTPVIISKIDDAQSGITINATAANVVYMPVVAESGNRLGGAFEPTDLADGYFIANDKFYKVSDYISDDDCVKVSPYRAYILTDETSSAKYASILNIVTDDVAASISSVIDTLNAAAEYYDLNGRRLNGLQKGLNIVKRGNKTMKVIIK